MIWALIPALASLAVCGVAWGALRRLREAARRVAAKEALQLPLIHAQWRFDQPKARVLIHEEVLKDITIPGPITAKSIRHVDHFLKAFSSLPSTAFLRAAHFEVHTNALVLVYEDASFPHTMAGESAHVFTPTFVQAASGQDRPRVGTPGNCPECLLSALGQDPQTDERLPDLSNVMTAPK